jgi:nucleolar protein 14
MAKKKKSKGKANPGSGGKRKFFHKQGDDGAAAVSKSAFETVSHRRKFDILGRKVKGERGNVLKARTAAIEKRRRTLLREHEEASKANAFVDRRFGEHDGGLSVEEKSIGRLAKARLRQFKKSQAFTLNDEDEDDDGDDGFKTLTHLGQPLSERDLTARPTAADDDDDDNLDGEMTRAFHFGGGDFEPTLKRGDGEHGDVDAPERRKSKKDVMEELIAKSKFYKAEKQKQREDDEEMLDKLDSDFKAISSGGLLAGALRKAVGHMKPTGDTKQKKAPEEKDEYDVWARTLAFERRGQAGDRAKTQEELEAQEKLALEQAERKRLKRMRSTGSDDESSDDDEPQGGYAARRRKARMGDRDEVDDALRDADKPRGREGGEDLDENFQLDSDDEDDEDEDGESPSDSEYSDESEEEEDELDDAARLRKSLKSELKNVDQGLDQGKNRLRKLGILQDGVDATDSQDEDDDDDDDDEDDDDDDGSEEEDGSDEMDEEEIGEEHANVLRELEADDVEEPSVPSTASAQLKKKTDTKATKKAERVDLPFTFSMPQSADELASMLGSHNAEDSFTIISRIRACNAPTLAAENRKHIQTLLGLLLQRFEVLAGESPLPKDHLDVLSRHIVDLSGQVPFFAATAVKARIEKMSSRLRQALRNGETGWPPSRTILLLSLFTAIFPTTDKTHPVMTPASLYIGNLLAHCAIRSAKDAALASIVATMASVYSTGANRIFPEALSLMNALVLSASQPKKTWSVGLSTHLAEQIGGPWLSSATNTSSMSLSQALDKIYSADTQDDELSGIALRAALSCLRQLARPVSKTPSASELLATVRISVTSIQKVLRKSDSRLADFCEDFVKELDDSLAGALKTPLTYHTKAAEAIKMYNPMYEEDGYQKGRDYDPNRERAEARKLKKQLKQESRGAMRELRKDNRFMADARAKEQAEAADERGARQKDILSFLEKQEADFKSGGQGGQIVKNKRRVSKGSRRAY